MEDHQQFKQQLLMRKSLANVNLNLCIQQKPLQINFLLTINTNLRTLELITITLPV